MWPQRIKLGHKDLADVREIPGELTLILRGWRQCGIPIFRKVELIGYVVSYTGGSSLRNPFHTIGIQVLNTVTFVLEKRKRFINV